MRKIIFGFIVILALLAYFPILFFLIPYALLASFSKRTWIAIILWLCVVICWWGYHRYLKRRFGKDRQFYVRSTAWFFITLAIYVPIYAMVSPPLYQPTIQGILKDRNGM